METDGDDSLDMIRYDKFLTVMTDVLMNRKLLNFYLSNALHHKKKNIS